MATTTSAAHAASGHENRVRVLAKHGEQPALEAVPVDENLVGQGMDLGKDAAARLLRYGCVVPFIGGGFVALYGAKELKEGTTARETRDGAVDLARGATSLAGSVSHLPMYASHYLPSIVSLSHPTMAMLGLVGGIAGTVQTIIDGVRDVGNGIKDHSASDISWGLVKCGIGAATAYASFTVNVPLMLALNVAYGAACGLQNRTAVVNAFKKMFNHE